MNEPLDDRMNTAETGIDINPNQADQNMVVPANTQEQSPI